MLRALTRFIQNYLVKAEQFRADRAGVAHKKKMNFLRSASKRKRRPYQLFLAKHQVYVVAHWMLLGILVVLQGTDKVGVVAMAVLSRTQQHTCLSAKLRETDKRGRTCFSKEDLERRSEMRLVTALLKS